MFSAGSNGSSIAAGIDNTALLSCVSNLLCGTRPLLVICEGLSKLATKPVLAWLAICMAVAFYLYSILSFEMGGCEDPFDALQLGSLRGFHHL